MTARRIRNLLGLAVLGYLTEGPQHTYELQKRFRDRDAAKTFRLSYGALYSVVRQLAEAGLVAEESTTREGNLPERTVYAITSAGRQEMHDWLGDLLSTPVHEHPSFVAALSLLVLLPPDEAATLLRERSGRLAEQAIEVREAVDRTVAGGVDPLFLVEDEYRLVALETERRFVDDLVTRIEDPGSTWTRGWRTFHAPALHRSQDAPRTDGGEDR